jgi:amino acid adenylation domain-containing protein
MQRLCPRLLHESLHIAADAHPDKLAIVASDERATYRELRDRVLRLARGLQERGIGRGDRVAIFLENSVDTVAAIYGALQAGAAFMVVNPQTKADKLAYVLADAGAAALIAEGHLGRTVAEATGRAPELRTVLLRGAVRGEVPDAVALDAFVDAQRPEPRESGVIPPDLAALIYTSGSTGNPKGVMLSHQNMVFTQGSLVEYLRLATDDRILNVLPLAFDYGLYQAIMAVHLAATLVLEASFSFPAKVIQRVREEAVTVFPGVPTVFATLLSLHRDKPVSMPTVRRYTNTAAHLPDDYVPGLMEMSPDALIFKMYGLTECKRVCYLEPELIRSKPSSVGRAIPGTETFVLDDDGRPVPAGVTGTLWVRGPHVMMGYWNLTDETAHMLKPGRYPGERMLCTHDLFRTDEDGFLYFVGRSDDIIKSRGEKVSPVEVENVLASIPGVKEAAVVGVPDELLGEAVRAFAVLDPGHTMDERAFRRACMARLENYMVPRDVVFLEELPKTGSGKVRRKSLAEWSASRDEAVSDRRLG